MLLWAFLWGVYVGGNHFITRQVYHWCWHKQWVTNNYQQDPVIKSFGVLFFVHYTFFFLVAHAFHLLFDLREAQPAQWLVVLTFTGIWVMIGWIDDQYGTRSIKGLQGHFGALFREKRVTTGMMKLLLGSSSAVILSVLNGNHLFEWVLYTTVMILSIHVLNLLDVRPGRAIKSFWLVCLCLWPLLTLQILLNVFVPVLLSTFILFAYDRAKLALLGDAGSMALGGMMGYFMISVGQLNVVLFFCLFFIILTFMAEKISFSEQINKIPWLSKLDQWGIR